MNRISEMHFPTDKLYTDPLVDAKHGSFFGMDDLCERRVILPNTREVHPVEVKG